MKKLLTLFALSSVLLLNGCTTHQYIKEENNKGYAGFAYIEFTSAELIPDKNINLTFETAPGVDTGEFRWKDVQDDVKEKLAGKGITLSENGTPVTITLDSWVLHGSYYYSGYRRGTALSGVAGAIPGLGLLANVGANLAERTASEIATAKDKDEGKDGDGRNFVPEVRFTIKSPVTESSVLLRASGPMANYLMISRQFTADAMQDFFEPAPAN
jgi:hypothetical protein